MFSSGTKLNSQVHWTVSPKSKYLHQRQLIMVGKLSKLLNTFWQLFNPWFKLERNLAEI